MEKVRNMNQNKPRKIIAFDFDGVIIDSIKETLTESIKAYNQIENKNIKITPNIEKKFLEGRSFAKNTERYFTLIQIIENNPSINFEKVTQNEFNEEHLKNKEKSIKFEKLFYEYREKMKKEEKRKWFQIQKKFKGIENLIEIAKKNHLVFIASGKDKKSIIELLKEHGIRIPNENIFSKDFSKSKAEQIKKISEITNINIENILLIDDSINYLNEVEKTGARIALARWGYSSRKQRKEARKRRIPIIGGKKGPTFFSRFKLKKIMR